MAENLREECSFEELLEQSFKTLNTGERVTGVILAVNPAEIKVDLGTKHTGILPYDEITTESGVVLADEFHVGDPIEVVCTKFNDSEGTVLLSKKRLDVSKHLAEIQAAVESGETLNGTVKEITRGGVVVQVKTATVFVHASQCGLPKDAVHSGRFWAAGRMRLPRLGARPEPLVPPPPPRAAPLARGRTARGVDPRNSH